MRQRTTSLLGAMAFIVGVFASLTIHPRTANAACAVTTTGAVNCNANTKTTSTINFDGALSESSDRTQHFNNGSPINATVGPRVTVSGAGLHLTEGLRAGLPREPVTMNNRGLVTSNQAGNLLQLDGNGAPITYFGNGSLTAPNGTALYVDNKVGNVSITTGPAHIISGSQGISASTTQDGTVSVTTGSGSVKGSAGDGILARSGLGALTVTIRSGGVSSTGLGWPPSTRRPPAAR